MRLLLQELAENPFLELQSEFSSYYKIDKFVRNDPAFKYVEPVAHKIVLPPTSNSDEPKEVNWISVSVSETLSCVTADPGFQPDVRDVKDGRVYKSHPFFKKHSDAYTLLLYSDSIELANPLGAKKGTYKLVNVYWTFAEIPKYLRSRSENWFLALSVKENDLKLAREEVYKPLLEDLCCLEKGIVGSDGKLLRAGLLCHIGDNLESHLVGGFNTCFSSKDICRICHCQYSDLPTITGIPKAPAWTQEEYDKIFEGDRETDFGLKERCVFNDLESFHAVGQFPLDPMHDFLEKVAASDAHDIIESLAATGKLSVPAYNDLLANLRLEDYESSDRPLPISLKSKQLGGKAMSIAVHVRLMPFLVSRIVEDDADPDLLDLLFMLSKLNEYMLADSFTIADSVLFEELVIDYLETRKLCKEKYPDFHKNTPKMHFLEHYAQQLLDYGPFHCTGTARCESRHRDFVNFAESSKNFINIVKTLGTKNQKKMASRAYSGFFSRTLIEFPGKKFSYAECPGSLPKHLFSEGDTLTDKLVVKNTNYKVGHFVVTKVYSENVLEAGCIMKIVVRQGHVYLLLKRYDCARAKFRYFDAYPLDIALVKYSTIQDYKPLISRSAEECPRFLLHHHLPSLPLTPD